MTRACVLSIALLATVACGRPAEMHAPDVSLQAIVGSFEPLSSPAGAGAGQPHVAVGSDGAFLVSWTEPDGEAHALKMSRRVDGGWIDARLIASRTDFFVNWADFPSIVESGDALYAHWLQRSAPGTYHYDVVVSISRDGGSTWGAPFVVHDDGVKAEHGFASMIPLPDNRVAIAWLDGREMEGGHDAGHGDMGLRYAVLSPDGSVSEEVLLDARTCECCTTTMTATPVGPLVAWRDRTASEIRDISFARLDGGAWTDPVSLYDDGWRIEGCPVNGPQADSIEDRVAIAWFTTADATGVVKVAFSDDGGRSFGAPATLAEGKGVVGYVDVLFVDRERALVVWMEDAGDRLDLMAREVTIEGRATSAVRVAATTRGRTGFPRMARSGNEVLLAWNEKGESPIIRMARATITD